MDRAKAAADRYQCRGRQRHRSDRSHRGARPSHAGQLSFRGREGGRQRSPLRCRGRQDPAEVSRGEVRRAPRRGAGLGWAARAQARSQDRPLALLQEPQGGARRGQQGHLRPGDGAGLPLRRAWSAAARFHDLVQQRPDHRQRDGRSADRPRAPARRNGHRDPPDRTIAGVGSGGKDDLVPVGEAGGGSGDRSVVQPARRRPRPRRRNGCREAVRRGLGGRGASAGECSGGLRGGQVAPPGRHRGRIDRSLRRRRGGGQARRQAAAARDRGHPRRRFRSGRLAAGKGHRFRDEAAPLA